MNKYNSEQALTRLAAYCSHAEHCIFDVRRQMEKWKMTPEQQTQIIQKLQAEGFLDEERYCKALVNDRSRYNNWGVYKIKYELRKKHISDSMIQKALENIDPEENLNRLRMVIEQKKKSVKGKNEFEIKHKLMRFAMSRGFMLKDVELVLGVSGEWEQD